MPSVDRVRIVPGLAMPFFPARPTLGTPATKKLAPRCFIAEMDRGNVCQPKLNGDRAGVGIADGQALVQNRHGGWLKQRVHNLSAFFGLGDGTCLDGEVIDGHFYPFEVLAWGGESFLDAHQTERCELARIVCRECDQPYLFATPRMSFIRKSFANLPRFDGWVSKRWDSPCDIMSSATQESPFWVKYKWA